MMKSIGFVALWVAGSAAAVSVAWAGVSAVDDDLIAPESVAQLSAQDEGSGQVLPQAARHRSDDAAEDESGDDSRSSSSFDDKGADDRYESRSSDDSYSSRTTPTTQHSSSKSSDDSYSSSSSSTSKSSDDSYSSSSSSSTTQTTAGSTSAPTAAAQTLTYHLTGGSTAISFSPNGVTVLWATPNAGYTVSIEPEGTGLKVVFRSETHRSRVDAWWSNGPQQQIREEAL